MDFFYFIVSQFSNSISTCRYGSTSAIFFGFNTSDYFLWVERSPARIFQGVPQILVALKQFPVQFVDIDRSVVFDQFKFIFFGLTDGGSLRSSIVLTCRILTRLSLVISLIAVLGPSTVLRLLLLLPI